MQKVVVAMGALILVFSLYPILYSVDGFSPYRYYGLVVSLVGLVSLVTGFSMPESYGGAIVSGTTARRTCVCGYEYTTDLGVCPNCGRKLTSRNSNFPTS